MSIRKEVMWFARKMEEKLRENDFKGHWSDSSEQDLLDGLKEEVRELYAAITLNEIVDEAVDVANMAMMIADNANREKEKRKNEEVK